MIELSQLTSIIEMLVRATDPNAKLAIQAQRQLVAVQIGTLIEADINLWFSGEVNVDNHGDSMVTSFVDSGFRDEKERAEFFRIAIHPDLASSVNAPIARAVLSQQSYTGRRVDLISDDRWSELPAAALMQNIGFEDFIISAVPAGVTKYSALGFHRRCGRPRFTQKEVGIVKAIAEPLGWMHQSVKAVKASEHVLRLSPRERQVVVLLMAGNSRKAVAHTLGLSEHTVSDYLKEIYRKFAVSSRAELLAKFIISIEDV